MVIIISTLHMAEASTVQQAGAATAFRTGVVIVLHCVANLSALSQQEAVSSLFSFEYA